ncbi:MAG: hypothetical protein ACYTJ0_12990 [Planctomycetota bacterium]|jgi:hypothetical protein
MTDKNKINDTDLENVAGGRSDQNRPTAQPDISIDSSGTTSSGKQQLTPEEAASLSGGRSNPTPTPTMGSDDANPELHHDERGGR